jgi:hypothetical protein
MDALKKTGIIKQHIKNKLVERAKVGHGSLWVACVVTWLVSLVIGRLYRETDTVLKKTVDTHKILINAIQFYVCLQEIW